jgi:heme exporter protein D
MGRFAFAVWTHLQRTVAALVSIMKPDVRKRVVDFVRCRWRAKMLPKSDDLL